MSHSYRHLHRAFIRALSAISSLDYRSVDFLDRLMCRGNLLIRAIAVFFSFCFGILKATGLFGGKFIFLRSSAKYTGV